jgi:hypothetical protein
MKIGINVFGVDKDGRSGLGTYFVSLLKKFPEKIKDWTTTETVK